MTLTPEASGGLALAKGSGGVRGCQRLKLSSYWWVYKQSYNPSTHTQHSETHTDGRETVGVCLTRLTDVAAGLQLFPTWLLRWVGRRLALMTHTHTRTHSFAHSLPQLSHQLSLTHQIYVLCADTHTNTAVFQRVCVCVCVCLFVCVGRGCVYHLKECTVFSNVKSSPQWSGVVQTHSVLLDGPEIPLCTPRGKSEEFKRFNMLSHCWGSDTMCACVCVCLESNCQHVFMCVLLC